MKLTDFGIAKAAGGLVETQPGLVKGTMRYIPPESLDSTPANHVHPRIDVYGTGVLLYACLTGKPLFSAATWVNTLRQITSQRIPKLCEQRPDTPAELERAFERAVARDPGQRYQSSLELYDDLQRVAKALPPVSGPTLAEWVGSLRVDDQTNAVPVSEEIAVEQRTVTTLSSMERANEGGNAE